MVGLFLAAQGDVLATLPVSRPLHEETLPEIRNYARYSYLSGRQEIGLCQTFPQFLA